MTTRPLNSSVLLVAALSLLVTACSAAATADSEIAVSDARVPVPAGDNGAVYMTLTNDGSGDDRLVAASTDIAEAAELHQTTTEDGSAAMRQVDGIDIPGGGQVVLEPGSYHIMLIGVTADLAEGDTVDITLTLDTAGERTVTADVVPLGDLPDMDMSDEPMDMAS